MKADAYNGKGALITARTQICRSREQEALPRTIRRHFTKNVTFELVLKNSRSLSDHKEGRKEESVPRLQVVRGQGVFGACKRSSRAGGWGGRGDKELKKG